MKTLYSLTLLAGLLAAATASAQDTCREYSIPNPHGAAMSITRVWVVDTVNFSVESINPLPHQIGSTGTFDIRVCIRARDGQSHSTIVRYSNTHGTSSYPVTMTAPATSGVEMIVERLIALPRAVPTPATSMVSIDPGFVPSDGLRAWIIDLAGRTIVADAEPVVSGGQLLIDVGGLANGRYLVQMTTSAGLVVTCPVLVRR